MVWRFMRKATIDMYVREVEPWKYPSDPPSSAQEIEEAKISFCVAAAGVVARDYQGLLYDIKGMTHFEGPTFIEITADVYWIEPPKPKARCHVW